jgi:hypothetical protein
LRSLYPQHEIMDEDEEDWLEHHQLARARGKGTPKKKRTAAGTSTCTNMRELHVLTISRIEEIQQAQVSARGATTQSGINQLGRDVQYARSYKCTLNERWTALYWVWFRSVHMPNSIRKIHLASFAHGHLAISCSSHRLSFATASRTHHPTVLELSHALVVWAR